MKLRSLKKPFSLSRFQSSAPWMLQNKEIRRLRAENARYKAFLNTAPIGYFTLDGELRVVESNQAATEQLEVATDKLYLSLFPSYVNSADRVQLLQIFSDVATDEKGDAQTMRTTLVVQNRPVPVMLHISLASTSNKHRFHVAMVDHSEYQATRDNLRIARDGLQHIANHDPLTRLANRWGFIDQLQLAINESTNGDVALLLLDLDHFKQINDPLGHQVGDDLLREVAKRLSSSVSKADTVGRLGGDEFGIILSNIKQLSAVNKTIEKIRASLADQYESTPHDIRLSASIGVSLAPTDTNNAKQLLSYADAAMNDAKLRGRNCTQFYTPALNTTLIERFQLERELNIAWRDSQFELHYQPQYDLRSRSINGYEVLLRWNHPQHGLIGPASFIQVVEDTGLIEPLGEWILKTACKKLVELRNTNKEMIFSINVSAKQFIKGDLHDKITKILASTGLPANAIELELTESALLENFDQSLTILDELREAGVSLAIDDFGTGYSSFSRLQKLPVSRVKIDRCFVHDIPENQSNCAIVKAIISVAHDLGIEVVAEGVETPKHARYLNTVGCDVLQGYYIGRPSVISLFNNTRNIQTDEKEKAIA